MAFLIIQRTAKHRICTIISLIVTVVCLTIVGTYISSGDLIFDHTFSTSKSIPDEINSLPSFNWVPDSSERPNFRNSINNSSTSHQQELCDEPKQIRVIIYAKIRSGSTFASEFFNKHRSFFYTFEPLKLVKPDTRNREATKWVEKAISCQFKDMWIEGLHNEQHTNQSLKGWKRKIFCYKYQEYLRKSADVNSCGNARMEDIESRCRCHPFVATKVITVTKLEDIMPLVDENTYVLYLVRDPRGVESSRVRVMAGKNKTEVYNYVKERTHLYVKDLEYYCQRLEQDLMFINNVKETIEKENINNASTCMPNCKVGNATQGQISPDIQTRTASSRYSVKHSKRIIVVRYEDLATNPIEEMNRIYDTMGIKPDKTLYSWALDVKRGSLGLKPVSDTFVSEGGTFSTYRRNPAGTAFRWRQHIPWFLADLVQQNCAGVMAILRYLPVHNRTELVDKNVKVLNPLPENCTVI